MREVTYWIMNWRLIFTSCYVLTVERKKRVGFSALIYKEFPIRRIFSKLGLLNDFSISGIYAEYKNLHAYSNSGTIKVTTGNRCIRGWPLSSGSDLWGDSFARHSEKPKRQTCLCKPSLPRLLAAQWIAEISEWSPREGPSWPRG